jgi:P27 family predicted phage terminase small subunit
MARPKLSDSLHALKGTRARVNQRGEHDREQANITSGRPRCPAHVKQNSVALASWKDAVRIMKKQRTLSAGAGPTLAVYAVVYSKWVKATDDVDNRGQILTVTRTTKSGEPYEVEEENPSVKIQTNSERQLLALTKSLGLSPDTREKVRPTRGGATGKRELAPDSMGAMFPHLFKGKEKIC